MYTAVPTVTTGELWTAANQNTYLRDNVNLLGANRNAELFIPLSGGYNVTDTSNLTLDSNYRGLEMIDNKQTVVFSGYFTPDRFVETMTVDFVCIPADTGFLYGRLRVYAGAEDEPYTTIDVQTNLTQTTISTGNDWYEVGNLTVTGVAVADFLTIHYERVANNANDTINDSVYAVGFLIRYTESNYG